MLNTANAFDFAISFSFDSQTLMNVLSHPISVVMVELVPILMGHTLALVLMVIQEAAMLLLVLVSGNIHQD